MRSIRNFFYSRYRQGARTVISHEVDSFPIIEHLIMTVQPKLIIELGTFYWGTTALFHEVDKTIEIHTFDRFNFMKDASQTKKRITNKELAEFRRKVFGENVVFHRENILEDETPSPMLITLLKRPELKLLYCDNGNKVKEVTTYARYLSSKDLLGVHDWGFEIDYSREGVTEALKPFQDLVKINRLLEQRNCSSRFFVRV